MLNCEQTKLVHVITVPMSLRLFEGQISYMQAHSFNVHIICSPGKLLDDFAARETVTVHPISLTRQITPVRDLAALWHICRALHRVQPTIVHSHTPKGGLLGMIGAWLTRVPIRVYQIRGLPFEAATGNKRRLLWLVEFIACRLAHRVLCNSQSNLNLAVKKRICPIEKITVLHHGSSNGVNSLHKFAPQGTNVREEIRRRYNIGLNDRVIGFVGRIVRDKGINELTEAWQILRSINPDIHLLIAGPFETQNAVSSTTREILINDSRVHLVGLIEKNDMPAFYSAVDLLVLPSYREGFPNALLEASAMALPIVTTTVSGCIDAVIDDVTGTLVPSHNASALANAIRRYLDDPELRLRHGQAGRERVLRDFRPEDIWKAQAEEYERLLEKKGIPHKIGNKACAER